MWRVEIIATNNYCIFKVRVISGVLFQSVLAKKSPESFLLSGDLHTHTRYLLYRLRAIRNHTLKYVHRKFQIAHYHMHFLKIEYLDCAKPLRISFYNGLFVDL